MPPKGVASMPSGWSPTKAIQNSQGINMAFVSKTMHLDQLEEQDF